MTEAASELPPGQVHGKRWVLYAALGVPKVDLERWTLRVDGLVERPLEFSYQDLTNSQLTRYSRSFHCLPEGGLVFGNPEPIEIQKLQPGSFVIGGDGRKHRIREVIKKRYYGGLVGVKASYLPPTLMTPDHPVLAVRAHPGYGRSRSKRRQRTFRKGVRRSWVRADKLELGDYVFFPKYAHVSNAKTVTWKESRFEINQDLASVIGWYVAGGSAASSDGRCISFTLRSGQTEQAQKLRLLLEKLFGAKTSVYTNRRATVLNVVTTSSRVKQIVEMFKSWCGEDALSKKIPQFVIDSDPRILRAFLESYFEGGGYSPAAIRTAGRYEDFADLTTSSRTLAYQLILALSKLEVPAEVVNHPGSVRNGYSVRVRGAKARQVFSAMPIFDKVNKFHYWETGDGFYYPIRRIWREGYRGEVFDFVAPGFTMLSPFVTRDCVTKWSIDNPEWEGVSLPSLVGPAGVSQDAKWVMFHCLDGYTAPIPVEDALDADSIVALRINGKPLSTEQGFPARPFMPKLYGWKSAKWLNRIEFIRDYRDGYWEMYGYHERGNVWEEERFKGHSGKHSRRTSIGTAD